MATKLKCRCGETIILDASSAGQPIYCPRCGMTVTVPSNEQSSNVFDAWENQSGQTRVDSDLVTAEYVDETDRQQSESRSLLSLLSVSPIAIGIGLLTLLVTVPLLILIEAITIGRIANLVSVRKQAIALENPNQLRPQNNGRIVHLNGSSLALAKSCQNGLSSN